MREIRERLYELHIWTAIFAPWLFVLAWLLDLYRTRYFDLAIFLVLYFGSHYVLDRHTKG